MSARRDHSSSLSPEPPIKLLKFSDWLRLAIAVIDIHSSTASIERHTLKWSHLRAPKDLIAHVDDKENAEREISKDKVRSLPVPLGKDRKAVRKIDNEIEEERDNRVVILVSPEPRPVFVSNSLGSLCAPESNIGDVEDAVDQKIPRPDDTGDPGKNS